LHQGDGGHRYERQCANDELGHGVTSCVLMPGQREKTIFVASVRQAAGWPTAQAGIDPREALDAHV
jgi:hypothetical protein